MRETKTKAVNIRLTPSEHGLIASTARYLRLTVTDLMRGAALVVAASVKEERKGKKGGSK